MKETRSVELETEDWACVDKHIRRYHDNAGWGGRLYTALYAARPPEPRTVEFEGVIWEPDEKGRWQAEDHMATTDQEDALFERIYELEHPGVMP